MEPEADEPQPAAGPGLVEDLPPLRRLGRRARRHWDWGRAEGVARLIEEDQLQPADRLAGALRRWAWRRRNGVAPGAARAVWVVGVQRSGTNMVLRGLERLPDFEVHNENSRKAFERYRLREDPVVRALIERSAHRFVLFKPLCDSHRVDELLALAPSGGRALWIYRHVDARARSAVRKFGDVNRRVLAEIAAGRAAGRWQAQRLSEDSLELIRSFDYDRLSAESAAALFWYMRNALYFEQGLDRRADVLAVGYEQLVADPPTVMRGVCAFLGLPFEDRLVAHVSSRGDARQPPLRIDPSIRERCADMERRLDADALRKARLLLRPRT